MYAITGHVARTKRHTTFYLACGAADATPLIFVHGWPELSISWRHQLPVFARSVSAVSPLTCAAMAAPVFTPAMRMMR